MCVILSSSVSCCLSFLFDTNRQNVLWELGLGAKGPLLRAYSSVCLSFGTVFHFEYIRKKAPDFPREVSD